MSGPSAWEGKAARNVEEWGLQDVETLLLAMQEEIGELTQAYLEAREEGADPDRLEDELDDLGALCVQLQDRLGSSDLTPGRKGKVVTEFDASEDHMTLDEGRYQIVKLDGEDPV